MKSILLLNTGTPENCDTQSVKKYLGEFLMDPGVIKLPWILRLILVRGIIVPTRGPQSAHKYQSIWTQEGSPLLVNTQKMCDKLNAVKIEGIRYDVAMRYGKPDIQSTLLKLKDEGVKEIVVFAQYPQFADATITSIHTKVAKQNKAMGDYFKLTFVEPFYQEEFYLNSLQHLIEQKLKTQNYDHVLFTYHGLPVKQVRWNEDDKNYKLHCDLTTKAIVQRLNVKNYSQSFQSRLGPLKWLDPSTDSVLVKLAQSGIKKLLVVAPSFTADCLETLEEIEIEGQNTFIKNGGELYHYVPCLNDHDIWIQNVRSQFGKSTIK